MLQSTGKLLSTAVYTVYIEMKGKSKERQKALNEMYKTQFFITNNNIHNTGHVTI